MNNPFRKKSLRRNSLEKKQQRIGVIFLIPLIIGMCFIFLPNLVKTFIFTLSEINIDKNGYSLNFVGLQNYIRLFTEDVYFRQNLVSTIWALVTQVPVLVIFSLFIATILNQKFKGRMIARAIFFVPVIMATGIISRIDTTTNLMNFLDSSRQLQTGTSLDNISAQLFDMGAMLSSMNFNQTLISIVTGAANGISTVVISSGMQIFIFLAGLQEIPESLYEAARTEGCSAWETFWKITFPMISPQIVVNLVYTVVNTFTDPNNSLFLYISGISAYGNSQYGFATAMYMVTAVCTSLLLGLVGYALSKFVRHTEG